MTLLDEDAMRLAAGVVHDHVDRLDPDRLDEGPVGEAGRDRGRGGRGRTARGLPEERERREDEGRKEGKAMADHGATLRRAVSGPVWKGVAASTSGADSYL